MMYYSNKFSDLSDLKLWILSIVALSVLFIGGCGNDKEEPIVIPVISTGEPYSTEYDYVTFFATISADQEQKVLKQMTECGFVWSTNPSPTIETGSVVSLGKIDSPTKFISKMSNVPPGSTYYFKAYVKMNDQVYYSNESNRQTWRGSWKRLKDFWGTPKYNSAGFSINGKGYIVGGTDSKSVWEYNPADDSWVHKNDFPQIVNAPSSFVINNEAYLVYRGIWKYNSVSDSWINVNTTYSTFTLEGSIAFSVDGKGYFGGGVGRENSPLSEYDPVANTVTNVSFEHQAPGASNQAVFVLGQSAYCIGGMAPGNVPVNTVLEYDFKAKKSVLKGGFKDNNQLSDSERTNMVAFSINGEGFAGMGNRLDYILNSFVRSDFYVYNNTTDKWANVGYQFLVGGAGDRIRLARDKAVYFVIGDKGYSGLGELSEYDEVKKKYVRTPSYGFWEFTP